jgi:hypothetical protein
VDTVCTAGITTVFNNERRINTPTTTASKANDVSVLRLRRERWAQELSSMLSANNASRTMVSSSVNSVCWF